MLRVRVEEENNEFAFDWVIFVRVDGWFVVHRWMVFDDNPTMDCESLQNDREIIDSIVEHSAKCGRVFFFVWRWCVVGFYWIYQLIENGIWLYCNLFIFKYKRIYIMNRAEIEIEIRSRCSEKIKQ